MNRLQTVSGNKYMRHLGTNDNSYKIFEGPTEKRKAIK